VIYRNDIEAIAARKQRLASEVEAKQRELEATARQLDKIKAKAKLPVLPNIRVASPCTADWNAMTPADADSERVRHCGSCNKNVYNLSQMTRDEAEALILAQEGRLCIRYYQRKDGTILLKDCTVAVANGRKRRLIAAGAAALLGSGAGAALLMRSEQQHVTGQIAVEPAGEEWSGKLAITSSEDQPPPAPIVEPEHEHVMGRMAPEFEPKMGDVSFDESE